jgi:8-oxo-dGTP pyrophosphatase MutT (NUDIX family)
MAIIRAAGGLLWRTGKDGRRRLAVIHRPHREDWSLPKGKLKDGEHWEEAALREVEEETGCKARIASFAGAVHYVPKRTPKVVLKRPPLTWPKAPASPPAPVLGWLWPSDAGRPGPGWLGWAVRVRHGGELASTEDERLLVRAEVGHEAS